MKHSFIFTKIMLFNSLFFLLITACMKTVPMDGASIPFQSQHSSGLSSSPSTSLNTEPLSKSQPQQDSYTTHIKLFRAAAASKTFRSEPLQRSENDDKWKKKSAKIFQPSVDRQKSKETFQIEKLKPKRDICSSCPDFWIKKSLNLSDACSNFASISDHFSMNMDRREPEKIDDKSDEKECIRTVKCFHPHMLVKWYDSDLCDVHSPSTGSLNVYDKSNTFVYKCNGTHWTMHDFPLTSVVCAFTTN